MVNSLKVVVISRRGKVPSPSGRAGRPRPYMGQTTLFMVLGVPLEHEWLVNKLHMGTPFTAKLSLATIFGPRCNLGTSGK
jgi:hypothetical protein